MGHVELPGRLEVGFEGDFGAVLQFEGGVGVEALSEIMDGLFQFRGAVPLLDHKNPGQLFFEFDVDLAMGPDFFLDRGMNTRLPPTLGIINYIQSTILIFLHNAILNSLGVAQTAIFIRPRSFPFGNGSLVSQLVERFSIGHCFSFVQKFGIRPVTSSRVI